MHPEDTMSNHEAKPDAAREMIDALKLARDRARVQAHLFSLDARKRWQGLEASLLELQSKLEQSGEKIAATATVSFREVTQAATDLMRELDGTLELAIPVRRLMQETPRTCSPEDSVNRAAQIMWELDCGAIPVVNADGALAGIITDRDICMAAYTRGQALPAVSVGSAMSTTVHSCSPDDSIGHAARLMGEKQVRRLPVTDGGRLVGILTLADIAREFEKHEGSRTPAWVALAHTLSAITQQRAPSGDRARAAE
jgi:CBS domain-containing protein